MSVKGMPPVKGPSSIVSNVDDMRRRGTPGKTVGLAVPVTEEELMNHVKEQLKARHASAATPGLTGTARLEALQRRLADVKEADIKAAADARKLNSETRTAAFKAYRKAQAMKRLEVALSKGDEKQVLAAVSNGADPNSVCRGGVIALHHAVEGGDIELITLLVQAGADVNMKSTYYQGKGPSLSRPSGVYEDSSMETVGSAVSSSELLGPTPLMIACLQGFSRTLHVLLDLGADPNVSTTVFDHADISPLCVTVCRNDISTATTLLSSGAVKHWADERGRTTLMYAVRAGHTACVKMLLKAGVDPHAIDYDGRNAYDWAQVVARSSGSTAQTWAEMRSLLVGRPSWWSQRYEHTPQSDLDALASFYLDDLVVSPPTKRALTSATPFLGSPRLDTMSLGGRSSDFDVNDSLLGNAGPPPPPVCQQCRVEPAKARCVQCAQFQCDRCCVSLHKQEGRRHHQLKHLKSLYSAEAQEVIALCHQPAASLGHSVGLARQVLGKLKDIVDESPLGTISMLREMESSIECEDMARDAEERASGMIHSSASSVVSKHGSLEIPGGSGSQSTVGPVGRRRLRSSVTELTFQKKNQGLEKFPAKSAARRKSDVMVAKEIALQRAKEKVRMLYQSAPELELAQFYISHGKLPDAEATVLSFVEELKGKVPEDDPLWFRSYGVILRLRCEQKMWGAAVAAGTSALSLVTDDIRLASPEVVPLILTLASALISVGELDHAAQVFQSSALRLSHCASDAQVRAAITMFLERADEVRSQLECTLMAGEDRTHDGGPATASDALGSQQDSIVPSVTELFVILLSPKWSKALKRMCRQDGTLSSLLFVLHVRMYRTFPREELPAGAAELVRKFIRNPAILPVLPMVVKNRLQTGLKTQTLVTSFDECEKIVLDAIVRGPLTRFLASKYGARYKKFRLGLDTYDKSHTEKLVKVAGTKKVEIALAASDDLAAVEAVEAPSEEEEEEEEEANIADGYVPDELGSTADDPFQYATWASDNPDWDPAVLTKYMKRIDASSGFPYYVDLETGSSTWDIPAPFQYEWEIPFRIVCVQCDTLVATNHCMECELSYCDACFVSSHGKGVMRRHRYMPLTLNDPVCYNCQVRFGMRTCLQCQASYCTDCLLSLHVGAGMSGHTWTSVQFAPSLEGAEPESTAVE